MKRYKELKKQLNESELADGGALGGYPANATPRSAFSDYGIHRLDSSEQVQRLQAFISGFTSREYLEPRAALALLRVKLNLAGIDFDFSNKTDIDIGVNTFPLKRFGGTFGVTPTTPHNEFETTDGFQELLGHGINLVVSIQVSDSGLYKMDAKILGAASPKLDKSKVI